MAKIKEGIFGPLSGRLGTIIGATWRGIPYLRKVSQKKIKTNSAAQIESRQKLKFINNLLVPFHPYITVGFMHEAKQRTAISAAFSKNYHTAVLGSYPDYSIIYSDFVISVGDLPMVTDITVDLLTADTLHITWEQNGIKKTSFDDQMMLVVYSSEIHVADGFVGGVKRADNQCTFKLGAAMTGKMLQVFISMTSLDRKRIANSRYFGSIGNG